MGPGWLPAEEEIYEDFVLNGTGLTNRLSLWSTPAPSGWRTVVAGSLGYD